MFCIVAILYESRWFLDRVDTQHSFNFKAEHEISCCSLKL